MYAVLVIAAILLSVGPMHARTLLAALPAGTPGHQFAPDDSDQLDHQSTLVRVPSPTRQSARLTLAACTPAACTPAPATPASHSFPCIPATSLSVLEHAPNAP